jgi:REP element-mobilizing transposase RayT
MARKLRVEFAGACYHVINRGNYRKDLFAAKGAAESFQKCLFETAKSFGWRIHAFAIMRNHFHLAVETPEPNLSVGMRWLQGTWAVRFNRFRGEVGRPFQGRYKALHVEPGHALAQVAHYIHLNPVRARVVNAGRLAEFRWSSLALFPLKPRPPELEPATILAESGGLPDTSAGWRRYLNYLEVLAAEESKLREEKFGRMSRGWVIGSPGFLKDMRKELAESGATRERFELLGADAEGHRAMQEEVWEEKLGAAAKTLGCPLAKLSRQKSDPRKVRIAALMKATTSASNGWLAERLQMGEPASVSQYVRRWRLAGGTETAEFKQALSRVNT